MLRNYAVLINGIRHVVQYSDADARALGILGNHLDEEPAPAAKVAPAPRDKARRVVTSKVAP